MRISRFKSLSVAVFSLFCLLFSGSLLAQKSIEAEHPIAHAEKVDAAKVIMEHVMDNHEFHLAEVNGHTVSIPLPIIVYSKERGLESFMSSKFEENEGVYKGYKLENNKIFAINPDGTPNPAVKVYDFSMTRNVVQMFLAAILLLLIMLSVAKKYKQNGHGTAPTGFQNAVEPVITFIRDEVGKPNLHGKHEKYMPYLLTVFFFILINSLIGLIPSSANVTGNIAFTMVLAFIAMIVILLSTNGHFWGHIFWPPGVPFLVKLILIPVEFAGIFIKPMALMIRLFANMIAGHIVIICFISLIFIFGAMSKVAGLSFSPVSLAFTVFIYLIELLVAFIQAFIFTNLTAVFIGQAFETGHNGHGDPNDHEEKEFAL